MELLSKSVRASQTEQINIVMSGHINGAGRLFGGVLVEWIDVVAAVAARRHSGHDVTTAAIDNLQFKSAAFSGDTVILSARLTYAGRTSMEVRVDTYVESFARCAPPHQYGIPRHGGSGRARKPYPGSALTTGNPGRAAGMAGRRAPEGA